MAKRSDIYKALRDYAKSALPWVVYVDMQKGQMQRIAENYPLPLPALLIETGDFTFSNAGEFTQKGSGIISFYLYVDLVTDSFSGAENETHTINMLDRFDELYQAFEGFSIDGITPINRVTEYRPQYGNRSILFRVDFRTVKDEEKKVVTSTVSAEPDITPRYKF